jgi:hypothetical protein
MRTDQDPDIKPPAKISAKLEKEESDSLFTALYCTTLVKRLKRYIEADGINPKEIVAIEKAVLETADG